MARKPCKEFVVESWNHPCFNSPNYVMFWGPYPLDRWFDIEKTLIKNFAPGVKHVKYKVDEE